MTESTEHRSYTSAEQLVAKVLAGQPWRNPAFALGYLLRRWTLSLWVVALCSAFSFPTLVALAIVVLAIFVDVVWTSRAFDLRISHREFVTALVRPRRLGNYGYAKFRRDLVALLFLTVAAPVVLGIAMYLTGLAAPQSIEKHLVPAYVLICGALFTVPIAYSSREIIESMHGRYEGKPGNYFISTVVPADNLFYEDLIPFTWWINLQQFVVTALMLLCVTLFAAELRGLYLDEMPDRALALVLTFGVYTIQYVVIAGFTVGFWLYRARLLMHVVRRVSGSS